MAEKESAGSIEFDIEVETKQLLKATKDAEQAFSKMAKSATDGGKKIGDAGKVIDDVGEATAGLGKKIKPAAENFEGLGESAGKATKKMRNVRGLAQNIGWQMQDIAVQLQQGTNALVVFGQQGSQIASAFGPMGAIAGAVIAVGAALGGVLLPQVFDTTTATELLDKANKELKQSLKENEDGTYSLTQRLVQLAAANELAARVELTKRMLDANDAILAMKKGVDEAASSMSFWKSDTITGAVDALESLQSQGYATTGTFTALSESFTSLANFGEINGNFEGLAHALNSVSRSLKITQEQAYTLTKAFAKAKSVEDVQELANIIGTMATTTKNASPELIKLAKKISDLALSGKTAAEQLNLLKDALNGIDKGLASFGEGATKASNQLREMLDDINRKAQLMNKTERERISLLFEQKMAVAGLSEVQKKAFRAELQLSLAALDAANKEAEAIKARAAAKKQAESEAKQAAKTVQQEQKAAADTIERMKSQIEQTVLAMQGYNQQASEKAAVDKLGAGATEEQRQAVSRLAAELYQLKELQSQLSTIKSQFLPQENLEETYRNQLAALTELKSQQLLTEEQYEQAKNSMMATYSEQRAAMIEREYARSSAAAGVFVKSLNTLQQTGSRAIVGMLNGTLSVRDAMKQVGNAILNEVVSSLVQVGLAQVKNAILAQSATATTTATTTASMASIASAAAPAAALTSAASFGGNTAPAMAGLAAIAALAAGLALGGGRKTGGNVQGHSMYRVGENNQPEIFQTKSGMQYMIPGNSGRVFSNKQVSGQGSSGDGGAISIVINQTNNFTSEDREDDEQITNRLAEQVRALVSEELIKEKRTGGLLYD